MPEPYILTVKLQFKIKLFSRPGILSSPQARHLLGSLLRDRFGPALTEMLKSEGGQPYGTLSVEVVNNGGLTYEQIDL